MRRFATRLNEKEQRMMCPAPAENDGAGQPAEKEVQDHDEPVQGPRIL